MSYQYIIDLNHNDELPVVIRKCNENFRAILSQRSKISQIDNSIINNNIAKVVDDFEGLLAEEAVAREAEDLVLQTQIDSIIQHGGDLHYVYTQASPSSDWTIQHNLGKYPSITVEDSAGSDVIGDWEYVDVNNVILHFAGGFSGKAYLN